MLHFRTGSLTNILKQTQILLNTNIENKNRLPFSECKAAAGLKLTGLHNSIALLRLSVIKDYQYKRCKTAAIKASNKKDLSIKAFIFAAPV
jgi:hypothetical protein